MRTKEKYKEKLTMGLSASQARLLSLTARQSNLEYEGQQINQQRTSLSNASSNYYNSLLEMDVPVPPSSDDYTTIVYTFTIGGNTATVDETLPQVDDYGNTTYLISYTTELSTIGIQENSSYKTSASAKKTLGSVSEVDSSEEYDEDSTYYLATMNRISSDEIEDLELDDDEIYVLGTEGDAEDGVIIGTNGYVISYEQYSELSDEDKEECSVYRLATDDDDATVQRYAISYAQLPNETTYNEYIDSNVVYKYNEDDDENAEEGFYSYKASGGNVFTVVESQYEESFLNAGLDMNDFYQYETTSGTRFVLRSDVEGSLNNQTSTIITYAVATIDVTSSNTLSGTTVEFDSSGRISTITDEDGNTYTLTATTETDNDAYDEAYNQYEYEQYVYDQTQTEINANIEILQAQDKSLELRLSTLDTQHSAIETEMEAVEKVMSKNIENSFATFNA